MKDVLVFLRENSIWLHQVLFEYKLIYWDLWTIVHFMTGALLFGCLSALHSKKRWKYLFIFLVGFEAVEATIFIGVLKLFMPEKIPDVFMDIFVGMAGGYFAYYIFERANFSDKSKSYIVAFISSAIIAFFWTGYYGYQLNIPFGNSTALNYVAFTFWWLVGIVIILMCQYFYKKLDNLFYAIIFVFIFVSILFVPFNYLIADVLNIHELSHPKSLTFFGLINVHYSAFKFMAILPILVILSYTWFIHLSKKVFAYNNKL